MRSQVAREGKVDWGREWQQQTQFGFVIGGGAVAQGGDENSRGSKIKNLGVDHVGVHKKRAADSELDGWMFQKRVKSKAVSQSCSWQSKQNILHKMNDEHAILEHKRQEGKH
ncbi:hypothetical protein M5K25_009182 [Dendrobium thyrsiflorum]|uniref:Uncharacterized protein n=1 Tax=Dendrobium thyrsiflorum TaxID=117978 RepID=A0ABD0V4D7_DENTH